ncbi:MAG TPA: hypothetical protein VHY79_10360 [Rhizomicrobium sp.]|nr:hypothetical protein [Rhizomicrobium sp.]
MTTTQIPKMVLVLSGIAAIGFLLAFGAIVAANYGVDFVLPKLKL